MTKFLREFLSMNTEDSKYQFIRSATDNELLDGLCYFYVQISDLLFESEVQNTPEVNQLSFKICDAEILRRMTERNSKIQSKKESDHARKC
jgi:hypothetical protein